MTDKELLKKLKKHKDSGLSLVIDAYSGLLYKIAANIILPTGTNEDVEECLSDSFLSFYKEIDSIDLKKASIKTYLALITKRKAIDTYRRLSRNTDISLEDNTASINASDDFTVDFEKKSALFSAVKSLGEPDTTIITRKYLLGETSAQIAHAMNLSEGAVQKRIERSREKLKLELGGVING